MELRSLPREHVLAAWHEVLPLLEKVSTFDGFDPLTVLGRVFTQEYQLYVIVEDGGIIGVFATQVILDGRERGLKLVLVAGKNLTEWFQLEHIILEWCKAEGFSFLEGSGRPGMEKFLTRQGYRRTEVTLRKRL